MFEDLKKLKLAINTEAKRLNKRYETDRLPLLIFNKRFREREKPGPKIDYWKRKEKIRALVSKKNYYEIIVKVANALIENWFPGYKLGYDINPSEDNIPIPNWYISRDSGNYPQTTTVNFYLKTEFEKGRPVKPLLRIEINFTPKITPWREFSPITIDEVERHIRYMFNEVYGEFALKNGMLLMRPEEEVL